MPPTYIEFPGLRKQPNVPNPALCSLVTTTLSEAVPDHIPVFTDGYGDLKESSATVAAVIPALGYEWVGRLTFPTSSTMADLVAIQRKLENLLSFITPYFMTKCHVCSEM